MQAQESLLECLADAYNMVGNYKQQHTVLEQALEIKKHHYSAKSTEYAQALYVLAQASETLKDYKSMRQSLDEALGIHKQFYGMEHEEYAKTLALLGKSTALHAKQELKSINNKTTVFIRIINLWNPVSKYSRFRLYSLMQEGIAKMKTSLTIKEKHGSAESTWYLDALEAISRASVFQKQTSSSVFRDIIVCVSLYFAFAYIGYFAWIVAVGARSDVEFLEYGRTLSKTPTASISVTSGVNYSQTTPLAALFLLVATTSILMIIAPFNAGFWLWSQRKTVATIKDSITEIEKNLITYKEFYESNSEKYADHVMTLCKLLLASEKQHKALEYCKKVLAIQEQQYGTTNHVKCAKTLSTMASAYRKLAQSEEGETAKQHKQARLKYNNEACEHLEKTLTIIQNYYGADHEKYVKILKKLASVYDDLGNDTKKHELLDRAKIVEKSIEKRQTEAKYKSEKQATFFASHSNLFLRSTRVVPLITSSNDRITEPVSIPAPVSDAPIFSVAPARSIFFRAPRVPSVPLPADVPEVPAGAAPVSPLAALIPASELPACAEPHRSYLIRRSSSTSV